MKLFSNLSGLLEDSLKRIYASEKQQYENLPQLVPKASSKVLKEVLRTHIENKKRNIGRLKEVFDTLDIFTTSQKNDLMGDMLENCALAIENSMPGSVADAALIGALQHVYHADIAEMGTTAAYAKALGYPDIATLLHKALVEEKHFDFRLTELAEELINPAAVTA